MAAALAAAPMTATERITAAAIIIRDALEELAIADQASAALAADQHGRAA